MKYMYKQTHMHTNKLTYKRNSFVSENTAIIIIIKFNLKSNVNNKNLTENNKNNLWKVKKKNNAKQTIFYFDTFSWNVWKRKIHINIQLKYITYLCAIYSSRDRSVHTVHKHDLHVENMA